MKPTIKITILNILTFTVGVCPTISYVHGQSDRNKDWIPNKYAFKKNMADMGEWPKHGNSCIIGPGGHIWKGPLKDKEGIIYCDILIKNIIEGKRMVDVVGNYARDDVFQLTVNEGKDEE